jgi:hypothetical protein
MYESISVCRDPEAKTTQTAQPQAVTPDRVLLGQYVHTYVCMYIAHLIGDPGHLARQRDGFSVPREYENTSKSPDQTYNSQVRLINLVDRTGGIRWLASDRDAHRLLHMHIEGTRTFTGSVAQPW